ncbi:hypothetical protein Forpe1208_v011893 [Fusarium oxysporum f. sp. rapae]|uniref:Uncharacterized protein n=1 Tax=Fusarium oxysporum f. sp. rapae TaxID=485398 RepID=A0A8J5NSI0_FUSOX|nr:hypothetical protein Forpe1208_v012477 [Fusarium oxysporum f. sp. rapae]KAG7408834.1 hypothetical protein Forpe1208_v011893 [Fusarium oxysporum f. sp. rapae]
MSRLRRQTEVERVRFILRQLFIAWESWPFDQRATFDEILYKTRESPVRRRDSTWITEGKAYFYIGERFGLGALFYNGLRRAGLQRPFRSFEAEGDFGQYMSTLANNGLQEYSNQLAKPATVIVKAIESWFKWNGLINKEREKATAEKERAEPLYHQSHKQATLLSSSQASSTSRTGHQITQQLPLYDQPLLSAWPMYGNSLSTTTIQPTQGRVKQVYQPLEAKHLRPFKTKESLNDGETSIHSTINKQKLPQLRSKRILPSILPAREIDAYTDDYRKSDIPVADIELLLSFSHAHRPMAVQISH